MSRGRRGGADGATVVLGTFGNALLVDQGSRAVVVHVTAADLVNQPTEAEWNTLLARIANEVNSRS